MRHVVPFVSVVIAWVPVLALAQTGPVGPTPTVAAEMAPDGNETGEVVETGEANTTAEVVETTADGAAAPDAAPAAAPDAAPATATPAPIATPSPFVLQATDDERPPAAPPPVASHEAAPGFGHGTRVFLSVQLNTQIGAFDVAPTDGSLPLERATVLGVPTAIIGLRWEFLTFGLGAVWTQSNIARVQTNFCTGNAEEFRAVNTIFGLLPTINADVLHTDDGRGRLDLGVTVPVLINQSSNEQGDGSCSGSNPGREKNEVTNGVYGVNLHVGGRYHVWEALTLGVEAGFSYLIFDQDENPDTAFSEPSSSFFTLYAGIVAAVELPL